MPNFKVHIAAGIYTYPLYILIFYLVASLWSFSQEIDPAVITLGFFLYVLGSDLPDIDAGESLARRIAEILIVIVVASGLFIGVLLKYAATALTEIVRFQFISIPMLFFIAVLAGIATSKTLRLFKHRGFLHSIWAGLIYSGIVFGAAFSMKNDSLKDILFFFFSAFFGYNLHLLLDVTVKGG